MKLTFMRENLSIKGFSESPELGDITLIVGKNGAGKTHLLKAILAGDVSFHTDPRHKAEILFLNSESLSPQQPSAYQPVKESLKETFERELAKYKDNKLGVIKRLTNTLTQTGVYNNPSLDEKQFLIKIRQLKSKNRMPANIQSEIDKTLEGLVNQYDPDKNNIYSMEFKKYISTLEITPYEVDIKEFYETFIGWGDSSLFSLNPSHIFGRYRDLILDNKLKKLDFDEGSRSSKFLDNEEFKEKYGVSPWDILNELIEQAGLNISISHPVINSLDSFSAKLFLRSSKEEVKFADLSSGEKIILSFIFSLFSLSDGRQTYKLPDLVLLDEFDAHLHPSMVRQIFSIIKSQFCSTHNLKIIATTHSPTTVALAPEESIYQLATDEESTHKLEKISKDKAISILTSDVPTLSVKHSNQRQVFCERRKDAEIYDKIYNKLKSQIDSERSLVFVPTGITQDTGDQGTGCQIVKQIVGDLRNAGISSVLGIIDWDVSNKNPKGVNNEENGIFILGPQKRDGLENFLLDPLMLAFFLSHHFIEMRSEFKLDDFSLFKSMELDKNILQTVTDSVIQEIFPNDNHSNKIRVEYTSNIIIEQSKHYMQFDDHQLENLV